MSHRSPNVSSFMNSYEREQLGWINFNNVTADGTTATVSDFATTGVAYGIAITNTSPQEYFLFENHQQISLYDTVDISAATGPGLYILQTMEKGTLKRTTYALSVQTGDGIGQIPQT